MQTQVWTYGDNRTTGVVNAFTEQVLAETTCFTFDHIGQRFQRTFVRTGDRTTATTVIQQGVNRFAAYVFSLRTMISGAARSSRRFRRLLRLITRRYRSLRSDVAKRPPSSGTSGQIWRQYRQNGQDHPLRLVARRNESFQQQCAWSAFYAWFRSWFVQLFTQLLAFLLQIHSSSA